MLSLALIQLRELVKMAATSSQTQPSFEGKGEADASVFWTPPQANSMKLDVDGALLANNAAAFGLVIRDHASLFVAEKCGKDSTVSALQMEVLAVLNDLLFAQDLHNGNA
uniref:RNase H type-1 domain-containing protein n=1 Tax=Nelumbo nucifera TaxID=4432 RepID=A0A822XNC5_NELNU|nr:TPA_asm: hypothetical protein HUJ06_021708 [Nelumbo nucifera]